MVKPGTLRRFVSDKNGRVVIGQPANLPIKVTVAAGLLAIITPGLFRDACGVLAFGAFFTWGWLELFEGAAPIRRVTGAVTLVGLLAVALYVLHVVRI